MPVEIVLWPAGGTPWRWDTRGHTQSSFASINVLCVCPRAICAQSSIASIRPPLGTRITIDCKHKRWLRGHRHGAFMLAMNDYVCPRLFLYPRCAAPSVLFELAQMAMPKHRWLCPRRLCPRGHTQSALVLAIRDCLCHDHGQSTWPIHRALRLASARGQDVPGTQAIVLQAKASITFTRHPRTLTIVVC